MGKDDFILKEIEKVKVKIEYFNFSKKILEKENIIKILIDNIENNIYFDESVNLLKRIKWFPKTQKEKDIYFIIYNDVDYILKRGEKITDILIKFIQSNNTYRKGEIITILGKIKDKKAFFYLLECLNNPKEEKYIKEESAIALGKLGDKRAIPFLKKWLYIDYPNIKEVCILALGYLEAKESEEDILNIFFNEKDKFLKGKCILTLARLKSKKIHHIILKELKENIFSQESYIKDYIKAIEELKIKESIPLLLKLLLNKNADIRKYSADALEKLEWTPSNIKDKIIYLFAKEEWNKLAQIKESEDYLIKGLQDNDPFIRGISAKILGKIKSKKAIPYLINGIYDKDFEVKINCLNALGTLKATQYYNHILNYYNKCNDIIIKRICKNILNKLNSE